MKILGLNSDKKLTFLYFVIIFLFATSINQYYGNLGICPIDSFWFFNSGYDTLNGRYPFKDYWTIAGPFITYTQALFFKILGVNWFSYVFHASIFNFLISIATFYVLTKFKLNKNYAFIYSIFVAVLAYPSAGTPYVDHHASILSMIGIFCFVLAIKTDLKRYWLFLPIILFFSFLTKQTPTGHFILIISLLSALYFIFNFNLKKILYGLFGTILSLLILSLIILSSEISFNTFLEQYILFPLTIGKVRVEHFLFPLEFSRIFLRYKLIHLSTIIFIILIIINLKNNFKYIRSNEFIIFLSLLASSYALIAHQLMTINGIYIFFIIPILVGFSHIYYLKYFKEKKIILYLLLLIAFGSTIHYGNKYINKRDFMDLRNAKFHKYVDAEVFSSKLKGLKWISCLNTENPQEEVSKLKEVIGVIKSDNRIKSLISDYQFISVILSTYDFSPSQVWFINHVVHQEKESKYYENYKKFFINKIRKNKIQVAYVIKPLWGGNDVFHKALDKQCYKKKNINDILDSYELLDCEELKN